MGAGIMRDLAVALALVLCVTGIGLADDLTNVQAAIKARAAKWVSGETSVSRLPPARRAG